jgi:hypothetical protein
MNQTTAVVLIVLVLLLVIGAIAYAAWQRKRSAELQQRFGPEYDHTVQQRGRRRTAEAELRQREKEHEQLDLQPLPPQQLERYRAEWAEVQQQFVDDPEQAVRQADRLAARIMADRGYPTHNFEEGAAQVAVDHPEVVQRYRAAHSLAIEQERGQPTTEELRRAVTAYRSLVDVLLEDGQQRS